MDSADPAEIAPLPRVAEAAATDSEAPTEETPLPRTGEAVDWWLKKWGREAVVSGDEPMGREDVEKLISVNGETAAGLRLDGRNLAEADLSGMNLREASLRRANLFYANLRDTDLSRTDLREADLFHADLRDADLFQTDLRATFLIRADFRDTFTLAPVIDNQTNLDDVDWGDRYINAWERARLYQNARGSYRQFNIWHQNHGHSDIAGEFLYREWICKRKEAREQLTEGLSWRSPRRTLQTLHWRWWRTLIFFCWLLIHEMIFGYGERPIRALFTAGAVILGFSIIYFLSEPSELLAGSWGEAWFRLWQSFHFSLMSFTTLGYGEWIRHPDNWARYLGGLESFFGLMITAVFLVTFTRKWTK